MEDLPNLPFSKEELKDAIENKLVNVRKHPFENLFVFNYSAETQYSRAWSDVTRTCRGLILDDDYNIVVRPFEKFFNYTEMVPDKIMFDHSPVVYDKVDGSLITVFKTENGWEAATRGSFVSDQALWATEWLNKKFPDYDQPDNVTCLFEAVYPDNRICVNYGDREELVLIAAINNVNGADYPLAGVSWWNGSVTEQITGYKDIDSIYSHATSHEFDDKEGVVCVWHKYNQPSYRLKVKSPEYLRLHKLIYSFSKKKVWETLAEGKDFLSLITDVPDEFYDLVKSVVGELLQEFKQIEDTANLEYSTIKHIADRKEFAEAAKKTNYPSIMFKMMDGQDYESMIWKLIKPKESS